jgi:hypothetical protein
MAPSALAYKESGFLQERAADVGLVLPTTYDQANKAVLVGWRDTEISNGPNVNGSAPIYAAALLTSLEIVLGDAAAATTINAYLSWDEDGDDPVAGQTQTPFSLAALQTANRKGVVIGLDDLAVGTFPPDYDATTSKYGFWLHIELPGGGGGTATLQRARLHYKPGRKQ